MGSAAVDIVRGWEVVNLIGEQRVHKIELERDHSRTEWRIEIILTAPRSTAKRQSDGYCRLWRNL